MKNQIFEHLNETFFELNIVTFFFTKTDYKKNLPVLQISSLAQISEIEYDELFYYLDLDLL